MQQMHNAETGINPSRCRLQQIKDNCCGLLFFCFLILYFAINDADLLGLLRKAYLVARKLKLRDFEEWINHELNGYGKSDKIPQYRIYKGEIKAWNPYHGWVPVVFDRDLDLSVHEAREPISCLVDVYNNTDTKFAQVTFNDDINARLSEYAPFPTKYCLQISTNRLFSTFKSIKNIVLDWAITLEENGILGDGVQFSVDEVKKAEESAAIYSYTNNFYGNVNNTQIQQGTEESQQNHE